MILISYHTAAAEARLSRWVDAGLILAELQTLTLLLPQLAMLLDPQGFKIHTGVFEPLIEIRQGSEVLVTITEI